MKKILFCAVGLLVFFLILVTFVGCKKKGDPTDIDGYEYLGEDIFDHCEYAPVNRTAYTIYYMESGKSYPVVGMHEGFEKGQAVHIYERWCVGVKYKVIVDPVLGSPE